MDAHESQFYEWLPWIGRYEEEVPKGKQERIDWLKSKRLGQVTELAKASLEKWYGPQKAAQAKHVELFEICEYGTQPNEADIRRLFPMLKK